MATVRNAWFFRNAMAWPTTHAAFMPPLIAAPFAPNVPPAPANTWLPSDLNGDGPECLVFPQRDGLAHDPRRIYAALDCRAFCPERAPGSGQYLVAFRSQWRRSGMPGFSATRWPGPRPTPHLCRP